MRQTVILLFLLTIYLLSNAQLGDFQLPKINGLRKFQASSADSTITETKTKDFFLGKNYRHEWTQRVTVPVIDFTSDFGGLKAKKEGGGKQTHSLHIESSDGREWVLRSTRKYFDKVIAPEFRGTIAEKIIRDGVSASYPYSTLSIGTLANAAHVPYFSDALVFIPDDNALGEFREKYKNSLSFLELKTVYSPDGKKIKTLDTQELLPELFKSSKNAIDQTAVLRARLFDNFIMDFDRHEEQWEWVPTDSAGKTYYSPIPKDRDQAFFVNNGVIPWIVSHTSTLGPLQGFRAKARNIATFNLSARDFDRAYLTEVTEQTWRDETDKLLTAMTDSVIDAALVKQPQEIKKYNAEKVAETLKEKRKYFKEDMMKYYRFLNELVSVVGSNENELFTVTRNNDGSTQVLVQHLDSSGTPTYTIYHRIFDPKVTKEIRLYGLEGDDKFVVKGDDDKIKIRMIGGPGKDAFENEGRGKNIVVYDLAVEKNEVTGKGIHNKINDDPLSNEYVRLGYKFSSASPGIALEYSFDGGLFLGPSYTIISKGFKKEPYAMRQYMSIEKALNSHSFNVRYDADFIKVAGKTDMLVRTEIKLPTTRTNFFGYGNDTNFDKTNWSDTHYRDQYYFGDFSALFRTSITPWFQLKYGAIVQYFRLARERNMDKFIASIYVPGSSAEYLYNGLWYAGAEARAEVDTRNSEVITDRGIKAQVYGRTLAGITRGSPLTQVGGDISLYTDALYKNHIILAAAFGGDHNIGDFEFPQAQYLGFMQNLRGFRIDRFAGRSRAYNNVEVRLNLGEANFYLFKAPIGILAFHDVGRVWMDGENSSAWHHGYGGGIWGAPFSKFVATASIAHSNEESVFGMISFKFQF